MKTTLDHARAERAALQKQIAQLDKVIALLGGEAEPVVEKPDGRRRKRTKAQRAKMREAWARRKNATPVATEYGHEDTPH